MLAPRQEGHSVLFRPSRPPLDGTTRPSLARATTSPKTAVLPHSETLVRFSAVKDAENPAKLNAGLEAPARPTPRR
ncbi:MAG: hypothetical protein V8Q84_06495 [Bilophila sp.]